MVTKVPYIEVLGTGRIDDRESAFLQAVQLPDGDILCSFNVGGGPGVEGPPPWAATGCWCSTTAATATRASSCCW